MQGTILAPDGVLIEYKVSGRSRHREPGERPALLFVHGWCCDRTYWRCQVPYFAPNYLVVTVDLAGHGASGMERAAWTMQAFGTDVAAVVQHLALNQVILIGHSLGGPVIVEAARLLPTQTAALIAVESFRNLDQTRTETEIAASLTEFECDFVPAARRMIRAGQFSDTTDPELMVEIIEDMAAAPPKVAIDAYAELQRHLPDLRTGLRKISAPKVLINADYRRMNHEAAQRYGFRVEIMTGVSHFLMRESPEAFNRLLDEVLDDLLE